MFHGLSCAAARRLAYEFATALKKESNLSYIPQSWHGKVPGEVGSAGPDWLNGFMKRHPDLALRKPESTSLSRTSAFNQHNVNVFFEKLKDVLSRINFRPENIYNMDESALTTVQTPNKVIAKRGARNIGSVTSAERGVLVTLALAVSASGVCLPPFYIFPRKKFQSSFLAAAGVGANGAANPSGWMSATQFLLFLQHFKQHARPSVETPVLLIMDNHESHMSIAGLDFCKANGIIVLTLPPHTSHKLQPLDVAVFAPIKRFFNQECDRWMRMTENTGRGITMHHIPRLACDAIKKGASALNIQSGFKKAGIFPLNEHIFDEKEFAPAIPTYRLPPNTTVKTENDSAEPQNIAVDPPTSSSHQNDDLDAIMENVRPLPKAEPRELTNRGRKRRKPAVLTDPDEMEKLRVEQETAAHNKVKKEAAAAKRNQMKILREVNQNCQKNNKTKQPKRSKK